MLNETIKKRLSPRAFSGKAIEEDVIISLFEAARWAPSGGNEQPWRFIFASINDLENFNKIVDTMSEGNRAWARNAPLLIIGITKLDRGISKQLNKYAYYDLASAVAYLTIQATTVDLFVHQIGGFNPAIIREQFEIPDNYDPAILLAVGYRGDPGTLPENLRVRELAPRIRKPLEELVFSGKFGIINKNVSDETLK
ncbi:MAG: nitroreductase family protein [Ignavibacteriales bacterium]